jgi:hypothetical protein
MRQRPFILASPLRPGGAARRVQTRPRSNYQIRTNKIKIIK